MKWGRLVVVGVYIPSHRPGKFPVLGSRRRLANLERCIRKHLPGPVVVAGDFNAHSALWGSPDTKDDTRGEDVVEWASALGLVLLNEPGSITFEATARGRAGVIGSTIDLTWASPSAASAMRGWRVLSETESLSDHLYIEVVLRPPWVPTPPAFCDGNARQAASLVSHTMGTPSPPPKRWCFRQMNPDLFQAAMTVRAAWLPDPAGERSGPNGWDSTLCESDMFDVNTDAEEILSTVVDACDVAMPRVSSHPSNWWSSEIAELRRALGVRRRICKKRQSSKVYGPRTLEDWQATKDELSEMALAKRALRREIAASKARAWQEILHTLDGDPRGRPYQIVTNKLRPWVPPLTETLEPGFLDRVIETLFPIKGRATCYDPGNTSTPASNGPMPWW